MAKRVGIVGIGIMGTAMMRNLAKDGFEVVGFDVAEAAMQRLAEAGGIAASSPRDVAERVEILITSLPSVDAFEQVTSGQGGIASSNGKGQIVIECSTLPLEAKERGRATLAGQGKILLDCPVSGTGAQAARKDLAREGGAHRHVARPEIRRALRPWQQDEVHCQPPRHHPQFVDGRGLRPRAAGGARPCAGA
jgi:L-threonate 2-dehydrogenase